MDQSVNVVYNADVSGYTQSLGEAMIATERMMQVADNAVGRIATAMSKTVGKMATFSMPKSLDMSPAIQTAAAYDQQLSLLSARAKASGNTFGDLGRNVRQLARDFPIGLGGSIQQFESLQRMGLVKDDLMDMTKEMTKLGAATGEMGPRLTESMSQFARSFGQFNSKDVSRLGDSVTSLSSNFGASASSVLDFSNAIAPLGKQMGMSATDVLGFSTAFSRAGEDGYRAANVFNKMLSDMERGVRTGSSEVKSYAEALGMTTEQFRSLASNDPTEAMVQFIESITEKGSDGIRILEDLGMSGARTMKSIAAVSQSGDVRDMIEEAAGSAGSGKTATAAEEAFNGLADSMGKVQESMTQIVEGSAKPMAEILGSIADKVSGLMSAIAGFVQSGPVQAFLKIVAYGGIAGAVGGKLFGLGSTLGAATGLISMGGSAGRATGANALLGPLAALTGFDRLSDRGRTRALGLGGLTGLGLGMATGNPLLSILGAGAMMLGPVRNVAGKPLERVRGTEAYARARERAAAVAATGPARELKDQAGRARDSADPGRRSRDPRWTPMARATHAASVAAAFLGGGSISGASWGDAARGDRYTGRVFGLSESVDNWAAGVPKEDRMVPKWEYKTQDTGEVTKRMVVDKQGNPVMVPYNPAEGLNKEQRDWANEQRKASRQEQALTGRGGRGMLRTFASVPAQAGLSIAAAGRSLGSMAMGAMGPAGLAMLGIGAGAMGISHFAGQAKEYREGDSALKKFADATGHAAKGLEKLAASMEQAEKSVSTMTEALSVGADDFKIAMDKDYEAHFKVKGGESAQQTAARAFATFGAQDPAMLQRMKTDILSQTKSQEKTDEILSEFRKFESNAGAGYVAAANFTQESERNFINGAFDQMFGTYFGKGKQVEAGKAAAENISADRQAYRELFGTEQEMKRNFANMPGILGEIENTHDREAQLAQMEALGFAADDAAKILDDAFGSAGVLSGFTKTITLGMFDKAFDATGIDRMSLEEATKESEAYKKIQEQVAEMEGKSGSAIQYLAGASGQQSDKSLAAALKIAQEQGISLQQLVDENAALVESGGTPLLTESQARAAKAYAQPENVSYNAMQDVNTFLSALGGYSGGTMTSSRTGVEEIGNQIEAALISYEEHGERSQVDSDRLERAIRQQEQAQQAAAPLMSVGQERAERLRIAEQKTAKVKYDQETGEVILSEDAQVAGMQMEGIQAKEQIRIEQEAERKAFVEQHRQQQIQIARQQEDFDISMAHAAQDAARQKERAQADHYRSMQYQREDYQKGVRRAQEDFDKQEMRAQEDFQRQMEYSEADYIRQREYQMEDFERNMARTAKSIAKSMMSPMERITAQRTWSAGGLAGNLAEQNEAVRKQLETLEKLKEQGLSQDAIDILGLADAGNAMQAASLAGMTPEEIAALNKQAADRIELGGSIVEGGWNEDIRNQMEDFQRQLDRQEEQYIISRDRMVEQFALSMARAEEDFKLSMARSDEDFNTSMARGQEAFALSMARMEEDMNLSIARQKEAFDRNIGRMHEDLVRMYDDLKMSEEERAGVIEQILRGETVSYDEFISNRIDTATGANTTIAEQGAKDVADATGEAQSDMADTTDSSSRSIESTARRTDNAMSDAQADVRNLLGQVHTTTNETIASMDRASASAKDNIVKTTGALRDEVGKQAEETRKAIKDKMKDMSWLLEWDGEGGSASGSKKEVLIKIDKASFDKTWGAFGNGMPGGSAGGVGAGTAPAPTPVMQRYADTFDKSVGRTHLTTAKHGTWAVKGYCLRNVSRIWDSLGQKLNNPFQPSAKVHANRVRGAMRPGYMAPTGALYWWSVGKYGHVAVADGKGNAINNWGGSRVEKTKAAPMSPGTYMGWTMPTALANGGIVRQPTPAVFGESGPEAVLPLDARGVGFLEQLIERYSGRGEARGARTSGYTISHSTDASHTVHDSSINTGPVTVIASDPGTFADRMRRRRRLASRV